MRPVASSQIVETRTLSQAREVREIAWFQLKKVLFLLSNVACALASFFIFALSLFDLYRIKNHEPFPLIFPVTFVALTATTAVVNLIGCLAVLEKSTRLMRFFYFLMWTVFGCTIVFMLYFLLPMKVCQHDYAVRRFRERVTDIMIGVIVIVVLQIFTLITGVEFTLVIMNEFHEADMSTIKSMCSISEYTLDS